MKYTKIHLLASALAAFVVGLSPAAQAQTKPLLIGQTYVQTGPLASLSPEPVMGVRAMLNTLNANGGINGRPVELRQLDDAYDPAKGAENVKTFVKEGAVGILMPIGTSSSVGALKAANELKIPVVGPYTGAGPVTKFSEYNFPVRISFDEEYSRIVNHLFTIGLSRIAFAHNDNPGARSALESTQKFIAERGEKMAGSVAIKNDGSDAAERAVELAKLKPKAVVLAVTNDVAAKFITAYRAAGGETAFYSFSFLNGQKLFQDIKKDAAGVVISQVVPYPWNSAMPLIAEYQAAMKKIGATEFSYASLEGYVAAKVMVEGLKRAGSNPTPDSLQKGLESFRTLDIGGIAVSYRPGEHRGLTFSELSMLKADGRYLR
ncbi:ABC-type branched-subunit amino acid transport system substrate-binding protein [Variovorax paradoxus]|jgi:ABC-type branched-subunit amino acid transport system substrate-binding protein|uniref:ABC transporter substrate-binding protein n=1 Tax=Variovorax paradoxus TaxID=34073 RepID=UPI00278B885C|nr:ABC transporter substrate-binding protein [Variovorax paradoxus]MDQ0023102.1 ABC-type branched-subunit amino acid transport system substrate-binding protein [Variovorax paradoxus]